MAIDARHHHNFLLPQLISNRELYYPNQNGFIFEDGRMGGGSLGVPLSAAPDGVFPGFCEQLQAKTSINTDSGLTCNVSVPRKRSRDCFDSSTLSRYPLGLDIASHLQQYQLEIDSIISQHNKKMRTEIEDRRNEHAKFVMQAIGEVMMKKLNEKDEQIQKMGKLNMILQERVKSLYVENQLWRDLAQSNEATANTLRTNLERVLAHVTADERISAGGAVEEDVQSCCGSCDSDDEQYVEEAPRRRALAMEVRRGVDSQVNSSSGGVGGGGGGGGRMCRVCGERESCVLLLPCRHLCLCTLCGSPLLHNCPVCNSITNATLHLNMS